MAKTWVSWLCRAFSWKKVEFSGNLPQKRSLVHTFKSLTDLFLDGTHLKKSWELVRQQSACNWDLFITPSQKLQRKYFDILGADGGELLLLMIAMVPCPFGASGLMTKKMLDNKTKVPWILWVRKHSGLADGMGRGGWRISHFLEFWLSLFSSPLFPQK